MKKLLLVCTMILVWSLGLMISEAKAQVAYGISIVRYNNSARFVDGYSGTALDYYAGYYYDPVVRGALYRTDMNEIDLDTGYDEGYADLIPAEVYLFTTNYVEGRTYCTFSQHFVRAYYYYTAFSQWFDPYRYSTFVYNGGNSFPGFPFSYYYYRTRLIFLGATQACIRIPIVPPPPTPTPPPPTPTPTPCDPNLNGACQVRASINVFPTVIRPKSLLSFANQTARVQVCTQPALANRTVTLELILRPDQRNSGGHVVMLHRPNKPLGKLNRTTGTTGSNGCFTTTYYPSHIAGVVGIDAEVIGIRGGQDVIVGFVGFFTLLSDESYNLIGVLPEHPSSHWGTQESLRGLILIADDFNNEFFGGVIPPLQQRISYNDISLQTGGKFDLTPRGQTRATWLNSGSHEEHREGINCDVRSNNVDPSRHARLAQIFRERGSTNTLDERASNNPHWHLRFEGNLPPNSNSSEMRNGIEQNPSALMEVNMAEITPHSFVEDAWEILDRGPTQAEWEVWHDRLVQAKAQGTSQLLEEIKVFEQNIFADSEYAARRRNDAQLVEDVFWSHLFRQPTQAESEYWQTYLLNLPPLIRNNRRRMIQRILWDFEELPEFEEVVNRIVDSNIPPEPTPTP